MDSIIDERVGFNPKPPSVMFIDLNSCFASCEQQADYLLRNKPIAVGAYATPGGCILAASYEAKKYGVETGMRVSDGRALCPQLIILGSDPPKYRHFNRKFLQLFREYTSDVYVKSIDEMVLHLEQAPSLHKRVHNGKSVPEAMKDIAREIKQRIVNEVGDSLRVSIGIAPNRYLSKIASGMEKPDGLTVIDKSNYLVQLGKFTEIEQLNGIKHGYGNRLRYHRIKSAIDFYNANIHTLKQAFHSIIGYHWWLRMHGYEADDREFDKKSIGHSYALYKAYYPDDVRLHQILCQLSEKMARRMRKNGYQSQGIHLGLSFSSWEYWHKSKKLSETRYSGADLYQEALKILSEAPKLPVRTIDVSCHYFTDIDLRQQFLFETDWKKQAVTHALDTIWDRWGEFTLIPARMLNMPNKILDRISFGSIKEVEEFVYRDSITSEAIN